MEMGASDQMKQLCLEIACLISIAFIGCGSTEMTTKGEMQKDEKGRIVIDDMFLAPESESQGRAALLPTTPSEDARHILGRLEIPTTSGPSGDEGDYLPEIAVSWVVDVAFEGDPQLSPRAVSDAFDKDWRKTFGSFMAYGRDIDTGHWTYLISADGPKAVNRLKFAFDYIDVVNESSPLPNDQVYSQRMMQLTDRLKKFGIPAITVEISPEKAAQRSRLLSQVRTSLDMSVVLKLQAPRGKTYDGKKVWDVMLCLGLEWGDMDCFHWRNRSDQGDDSLFSVETSSKPGYFLPEEIVADRLHVDDLIFVYSVPRSTKPVEVFDGMAKAVQYCQSRLGGEIVTEKRRPTNIVEMRKGIEKVVEQLRQTGFEPGTSATLQLF